jgi:hypothetical protein
MKQSIVTVLILLGMGLVLTKAQTLPFALTGGSGSTAVDFEWRLDGTFIEKGAGTTTLSNSDVQASSVFLWYPVANALRVGGGSTETVSGIGSYSATIGYLNSAAGTASFSAGLNNRAASSEAVAMGNGNYAGYCSTSIGQANSSTAAWSCAIGGYGNTASSSFATAMGGATLASGAGSTSTGYSTVASGQNSATFNFTTTAASFDASAFGQFNIGLSESGATPSGTTWANTVGSADPLFEIGNGTSATAKSDALAVYKDGNAVLQGVLKTARGGDIPMYPGD